MHWSHTDDGLLNHPVVCLCRLLLLTYAVHDSRSVPMVVRMVVPVVVPMVVRMTNAETALRQ